MVSFIGKYLNQGESRCFIRKRYEISSDWYSEKSANTACEEWTLSVRAKGETARENKTKEKETKINRKRKLIEANERKRIFVGLGV